MKRKLKIEVANHVVGLDIDEDRHPSFVKDVLGAYDTFISGAEPTISVDVELTGDAPPEYFPSSRLIFENGIITIEDDCLLGSLDLQKKRGRIKLNPVNPLYPLGTFLRNVYTFLVVLEDKGVALHAVGVLEEEEAHVFIGPSTAGKSTVASLSPGKVILSDDLILAKKVNGEFKVFPTPAWGDRQTGPRRNRPYRIKNLFKLIKDKTVYLEKFSPAYALANIFTVPHIPAELIPEDELLTTFSELLSAVPCYGMHFLPEPSFWQHIGGLKYED